MKPSDFRWLNAALAAAFILALAAPLPLRVSADGERVLAPGGGVLPELCMYKRTTGDDCMSCHLGRSVILAAHGDWQGSLQRHRGGVILYGWTALQALTRLALAFASAFAARFWILDLSVSMSSLTAALGAVLFIGR